jgi:hypothetical protein
VLLEHDSRFSVFPEFVPYDFAQPIKLPGMTSREVPQSSCVVLLFIPADQLSAAVVELKGSADRIICDPPFLSEDCQTKGEITRASQSLGFAV